MPHLTRDKEGKSFREESLGFLNKPVKALFSLKKKKIVFNAHPSSDKKTSSKTNLKENNTPENNFDIYLEAVDQVDGMFYEKNNLQSIDKKENTVSPIKNIVETWDPIHRHLASSELELNGFPDNITHFDGEIDITDPSYEKYFGSNNYSGIFYSKVPKIKLSRNKKGKDENQKIKEEDQVETSSASPEEKEADKEESGEERLRKEIDNLKNSINEREKSLSEKEEEIVEIKGKIIDFDKMQKDHKKDVESEKKLLSKEEKEIKKLEKKLDKIKTEKNSKEKVENKNKQDEVSEKKEINEETVEDDDSELIAEVQLEGSLLDEDVKKLIPVLDELLGELPEETIDDFANSDDFSLYEKVVKKYKNK